MTTTYILNANDVILEVGGKWDSFALENEGSRAIADLVRGESLWRFVRGADTISYLNALFFACRERGVTFVDRYRCDSTNTARYYEMTITPLTNIEIYPRTSGVLMISHDEIDTTRLLTDTSKPQLSIVAQRCSVCCCYKMQAEWLDPLTKQDTRYSPGGFDVCIHCKKRASSHLKKARDLWSLRTNTSKAQVASRSVGL